MPSRENKISIITINYNNKEGLQNTFSSVFSQTLQSFEYIIIDGGSSDGGEKLIEEYKERFAYWICEPDKGIYNAINKGLKKASGEYILILNSGDSLFSSKVLEEVISLLSSGEDVIYGESLDYNIPEPISEFHFIPPSKLDFSFFLKDSLRHQAVFIKKELHDRVGHYDENYAIVSDWKFLLLAIGKWDASYKKIDHVICRYDRQGISSINKELDQKERCRVLKEHFSFYVRDEVEIKAMPSIYMRILKVFALFVPYGFIAGYKILLKKIQKLKSL